MRSNNHSEIYAIWCCNEVLVSMMRVASIFFPEVCWSSSIFCIPQATFVIVPSHFTFQWTFGMQICRSPVWASSVEFSHGFFCFGLGKSCLAWFSPCCVFLYHAIECLQDWNPHMHFNFRHLIFYASMHYLSSWVYFKFYTWCSLCVINATIDTALNVDH